MRKTVNGKRYNTENSTLIAWGNNGFNIGDMEREDELLYRKKNGEFFILGEGGILTKYAVELDDGTPCSGADIIPIDIDEAKEWVKQYCDSDIYKELFGLTSK